MTFDAVIVGGGIVGTACALAFSRSAMRVALVERSEIGAGATAAAMGHVVVLDDSPAQLALTRYSQIALASVRGRAAARCGIHAARHPLGGRGR